MPELNWSFVIFIIEGKANHVAVEIPGKGIADLSLRGARIIPVDHPSFPRGEIVKFAMALPEPERAVEFLSRPGLLMQPIIAQEKKQRGWHLTPDAPDFVRTIRSSRSRSEEDMNCVEWILYAVEQGGVKLPDDILTPTDLLHWCRENLREVTNNGESTIKPVA